jgi:hypothetical protein
MIRHNQGSERHGVSLQDPTDSINRSAETLADLGTTVFLNALSAGLQQRTKMKLKERKDHYYAIQSQHAEGLQIEQP